MKVNVVDVLAGGGGGGGGANSDEDKKHAKSSLLILVACTVISSISPFFLCLFCKHAFHVDPILAAFI